MEMKNQELYNKIESKVKKSQWDKGVQEQALEMVEDANELLTAENCVSMLLNGAGNWFEYSYGGNALIYDGDIADRYCTQSELKRTKNGQKRPNKNEYWLDLQARACQQAFNLIYSAIIREKTISWLESQKANGFFQGHPENVMNFNNFSDEDLRWYHDEWLEKQ